MINKIKEFSKKYIIGIVFCIFLIGIVCVYATTYFPSNQTTYNNKTTGMKATNVQAAIDELYNKCSVPVGGDGLLNQVDVVTSGDGLYKDEYECRYFYRGANPNNYITFNGEEAGWRILSIECDGTIKLYRIDGLDNYIWWNDGDYEYFNSWIDSERNIYLNNAYYNSLTSSAKKQVVLHDFAIESGTEKLGDDMVAYIAKENSTKWNGNIGLISMSEAVRTNSDKDSCGTVDLHYFSGKGHSTGCEDTNWIFSTHTREWWTFSNGSWSNGAYIIKQSGGYVGSNQSSDVRPTLYLSSSVKITGGTGTKADPFTIQ